MGRWISNFNTTAELTAFSGTTAFSQPHVSLTKDDGKVHYIPIETRVVAKYNVTSTSSPTALRTSLQSNTFKSMEIDGVMLDELVTEYTFDTTGIHTVKYELYDETKLGNSAPVFNNNNLVECVIPDSVTSIGSYAFQSCTSLTTITMPNGVTSIDVATFRACRSLTSIDIPSGVTSIGNSAFQNCSGLTSIDIPSGVTSIGISAFTNCSSLTNINIPDSITSIDNCAFYNCSSLTSCTIGSGVTSIGAVAFYDCSSLSTITSHIMSAPSVSSGTFANVKTGGTLYVPIGSSGYETWMNTQGNLGLYNWTKVEQ